MDHAHRAQLWVEPVEAVLASVRRKLHVNGESEVGKEVEAGTVGEYGRSPPGEEREEDVVVGMMRFDSCL